MPTNESRKRFVRLCLGAGAFFALIVIACATVGTSMFFTERGKVKNYVEDSCLVRSASYKTISVCKLAQTGSRGTRQCYVPVWDVDYGRNGTKKAVIQGSGEHQYKQIEQATDKYRMGQSYRCWYNKEKQSQVIWVQPSTSYQLFLLIIAGVCVLLAVGLFGVAYFLRDRADL